MKTIHVLCFCYLPDSCLVDIKSYLQITESSIKMMQVSAQHMMLKYPAFVTNSFATCTAENSKTRFSSPQMNTYVLSWIQHVRLTAEL